MSPINRNTLGLRVDKRLAGYAVLAGAALSAPAIPNADADIIYSGPVSINITSTTQGVYLNVVSGLNSTNSSIVTSWDVNPWSSSGLGLFNPAAPSGGAYVNTTAGGSTAINMAFGASIDAGNFYGSGSSAAGAAQAQWNLNSSNNLIGFRFVDPSIGGGATVLYGWMRISLGATPGGQPRAIVEYAYENAGASIGAGVVPEPTVMALLSVMATGALGVRAWRKRKAA
jgi:hypothetical protein